MTVALACTTYILDQDPEINLENITRFALAALFEFEIPITATLEFGRTQHLVTIWNSKKVKKFLKALGLKTEVQKIRVRFDDKAKKF